MSYTLVVCRVLSRSSVHKCVHSTREPKGKKNQNVSTSAIVVRFNPRRRSFWFKTRGVEQNWVKRTRIGDQRKRVREPNVSARSPPPKKMLNVKWNRSMLFFSWSTEKQKVNEEKALNWQRERMRGEGESSSSSFSLFFPPSSQNSSVLREVLPSVTKVLKTLLAQQSVPRCHVQIKLAEFVENLRKPK